MVLVSLIFAGLLLAFAAFAAFGLPWLIAGGRAFEEFSERRDQKVMAGTLAALVLAMVSLPFVASAFEAAGPHLALMAQTVLGVPERFWS
ncbi:hypothetical protein [Hyphomonas sp.]|uniref:hypothetical protein n=1 Tax=Hyphomonas sp. TaxID=87 RepID=UPI0039193CAB